MESLEQLKKLILSLAPIPAPSLQEDKRADFCLKWLHDNGVKDAYVDEAKNVICPFGNDEGEQVVVCAHIDTVFPDLEPYDMREEDGKLYCPGIGDNTANAAILMFCAKTLSDSGKELKHGGLKLVLNSGEEGFGNLKGCRAIVDRYKERIHEFIAFDLSYPNIITTPIGSKRFHLNVQCKGGHSFYRFGNENAIATLSSLICRLYDQTLPEGEIATFNVGKIEGGTSVNTIAEQAEAFYEIRAIRNNVLEMLHNNLTRIIEEYKELGHKVEAELLAMRPCGSDISDAHETLFFRVEELIRSHTGQEPCRNCGSTDCNYPASLSIPAVCIGLIRGYNPHTRNEYIELNSLEASYRLAMAVLNHYFEN